MRAGVIGVVALVCLGAAGCGSEDEPSPEQAVRSTLTKLVDGVQDKRYDSLCTEVFDAELVDGLEQVGLTCPQALAQAFDDVRGPQLSVDQVEVDGDAATAQVRTSAIGQAASTDTVRLTRTKDGWRVTSLGSGSTPAS